MTSSYSRHIPRSMLPVRRHHLNFAVKQLSEEGVLAGYASVFDVRDSQQDIITRGAFTETIRNRTHEIKLLWQHDMREPIGTIDVLKEDARGLYMEARLFITQVARAKEAYHLIKTGVVQGLSIGYSPTRYRMDAVTRTRIIAQLDLWEISLVTFPANPHAQITVVKSAHIDAENRALEQALDRAIGALQQLITQ
jgi:HK97 family phage prohead protease